jgi:HEAT repeat protein
MSSTEQSIGVFTTDAELKISSWDASLERFTGVSVENVIGRPLDLIIPDLRKRGLLARFERTLADGVVEVLAPAFHHYLIPCAPQSPSRHFDRMQQRVTIAPLRTDDGVIGVMVTLLDVTARLDRERELSERLASPDEKTRLQAAEALVAEENLESGAGLVGALNDESWRVRKAAVSGLAHKAEPETITSLLKLLKDEHHNLSILSSALQVLTLSDVDVISPLTEFLGGPDVDLRIQAALALGEQRDPRSIPPLLSALRDTDINVRYHAIEAIGKLRAAEAVDELLAIAHSGEFFLSFPAIEALIQIGDSRAAPRLAPLLEDELLSGVVAEALGRLGDEEVVAPLATILNQPNAAAPVIAQSLAALYHRYEGSYQEGSYIADLSRKTITATGAQNLLDALDDAAPDQLPALALVLGWLEGAAVERALARLIGQPGARKEVITALVRYGSRVTDLLIEQLDSEEYETRQAAVIALGHIGDRRAVPGLLRALSAEQGLVIEIAGALAKLGDPRAFESLLGLIGEPDAGVRQAVISAINSLGHPEMAGRAVVLLQNPDPLIRESAVKIAGYFGYPECMELLLERCADVDENVRRYAVEHLPFLDDDDRMKPVLEDALKNGTAKVRAAAVRALGQIETEWALSGLLAAIADVDPWVRYFAARSIGRHRFLDSMESLARLANTDPAGHVRIAAIEALGRLGGVRAVSIIAPLTEALERDIACAALTALGSIGHPDSLPPLQAALHSAEPARRTAAVSALAMRGGAGAAEALQRIAVTDEEASISRMAVESLARLGTPDAVAALTELTSEPARREDCILALSRLEPEQIPLIAVGLNHANPEVRQAVVEALGRMKHSAATDQLIEALEDAQATVRLSAVQALRRLGTRQADRKLSSLANTDPDLLVRRAAGKAVGI